MGPVTQTTYFLEVWYNKIMGVHIRINIYIHTSWWFQPIWKILVKSQNGNLPQVGVKIKNLWNHHLYISNNKSVCMEDIVALWLLHSILKVDLWTWKETVKTSDVPSLSLVTITTVDPELKHGSIQTMCHENGELEAHLLTCLSEHSGCGKMACTISKNNTDNVWVNW